MSKLTEEQAFDLVGKTVGQLKVRKLLGRTEKQYKNLNCKIYRETHERLDKFVKDTSLSKTATVERALKMYIEHYNKTGKI